MKKVATIGLLFFATVAWGQNQYVENVRQRFGPNQDTVLIYYDLISQFKTTLFQTNVFIRTGETERLLRHVTGAVGDFTEPGKDRVIKWAITEELIQFNNEITIIVKSVPMALVPPQLKRNKNISLKLDNIIAREQKIKISLYRNERFVGLLDEEIMYAGAYDLSLPRNTKPQGSYQLCFENSDRKFFSNSFRVRRKVALFWKILPFACAAAAGGYLWYSDNYGTLPEPPNAPSN